ncbi:MAG: carboxylesterase/lipase family protein [Terrabacter sp.]
MHVDVRVAGGVVRGVADADLTVFRGIPYASVPQRLAAPARARPWRGTRDCTAFGPAPPQSAALGTDAVDGLQAGDEWLTVNVWSADVRAHAPVMVWIQGGAYAFGTSGLPEYDGSTLARGGVVVVTFNYRVGLEGFGHVAGRPDNRGLLDQVAALRWVQDEIERFGGDPGRVTVFGQSAGAGSVAALLVMPRAEGLFHQAIAQSVPGTFFTPALADDITRACAAELGLEPDGLADVDPFLLPLAADAVAEALAQDVEAYAVRWGRAAHALVLFAPVVDGDVLPTTPWEGLRGDVPLVVGHTRDEQRLLTALTGRAGAITPAEAARTADVFAPDPARCLAHFTDPEQLYEVVRSDWLFRMPSLHLAEAQLRAGGAAWLYELTWPAPGMGGSFGACHGLDVPLVFGNLTAGQPAVLIGDPSAEAVAMSGQMRAAWRDFAVHGDPGWPAYGSGTTHLFDLPPSDAAYPEQLSREVWRDHPDLLDLSP